MKYLLITSIVGAAAAPAAGMWALAHKLDGNRDKAITCLGISVAACALSAHCLNEIHKIEKEGNHE